MGAWWELGASWPAGAAGTAAMAAVAAGALSAVLVLGWRRGAGTPQLRGLAAALRHLADRYGARSVPSNLISAVEPPSEAPALSQRPGPPPTAPSAPDPPSPVKAKTPADPVKPEPTGAKKAKGKGKKLREHPKNPLYDTLRNINADEVLGEPEDGPDIDKELAKGKNTPAPDPRPEDEKPPAKTAEPDKPAAGTAEKGAPEVAKPDAAAVAADGSADRSSQDDSLRRSDGSGGDAATGDSAPGTGSLTSSRPPSSHV